MIFSNWNAQKSSPFYRKFPLFLTLLSASVITHSQSALSQVVFGGGPSLTTLPSFGAGQTATFGNNTICPVPSFSVSAFGGAAEDFANINVPLSSSDRGINNFGGVIGLTIPIGGSIGRNCKESSEKQTAFQSQRTENQLRNAQLLLVQQCAWLSKGGFLTERNIEIFSSNENYSTLLPCLEARLEVDENYDPTTSPPPLADEDPPSGSSITTLELPN